MAWSNPNFELWLLAHFKKVNRYVSKDDVLQELSKEFQKEGLGDYTKNDTNIFDKVTSEGRLHTVIKIANIWKNQTKMDKHRKEIQ